ncbi:hypothetical protein HUG17_7454 [Dermatophagoides farinae]|uniref:Uncharacterized protein n=1 Tax=Dermatophagoides farinae TaxID=6954 RepID=A0A9D4NS91_DERFA|nr:hypothetical protein HUG17_7454 [Dermatophagoides farinae]
MAEILKEKEEIKEFLKNLGIEYRFSCYSEKNPQGCQLLADYLSQVDNDDEKANKVLKENCDERNYGRSCSTYGMNLLNGRAGFEPSIRKHISPEHEKGLRYLERGCNMESTAQLFESIESCHAAAFMYASGVKDVFARDDEKAIEYGTKACNSGNMNSCKLLSIVYKRMNNEEMSEKFMAHYERLKKQISDNVGIEMQRS